MRAEKLIHLLLLSSILLAACAPNANPSNEASLAPPDDTELAAEESPSLPAEDDVPNDPPAGAQQEFSTDFSITTIFFDDVLSGGPPKDGIPSIDRPKFEDVDNADVWIQPREPIIQVAINGEVKGYPIQILMWHEIVNDVVGGVPVVVTFCPLCNTALVFERSVENLVLDFGTTGRLRFSNLIMYDRQTETWWQQGSGAAIVGKMTGIKLEKVPAAMVSWEAFKAANPDSMVLSRDTGHNRPYGQNPYVGYDDVDQPPFLYQGPAIPGALAPVARIIAVEFGDESVAYPYDVLAEVNVVNDTVGGTDLTIFWASGTASALDTDIISEGQDVGSAVAYDRNLDGQVLTFEYDGEFFVDQETGSLWDLFGRAVSGPLTGGQLTEIAGANYLWFSWAAFKPETSIYQPGLD